MEVGAVIPQSDIRNDVGSLRDYVQAVEGLGYDFLVTSDHVVGADAKAHPELERVFPLDSIVHEPFALFGYVAGLAPRLGMLTSVIILPQRQAVLAAKQAAELDVLSKGKFRFGVGIGWNPVEFESLGMPFKNRARRFEEQIDVMRRLWREPVVTFEGRYHTVKAAGINPMPVNKNVPIWIGAHAAPGVKRACEIGDGYLPLRPLDGGWQATIDQVEGWLAAAGRKRNEFGIEGRLDASRGTTDEWGATVEMWRGFGASHLSVGTGSLGGVDAHVARLREVKLVLG